MAFEVLRRPGFFRAKHPCLRSTSGTGVRDKIQFVLRIMRRPIALILALLTVMLTIGAEAPPPPVSVIQGTVRAQGQPVPPETVVYLEAKDPTAVHFGTPEKRVRI